MTYTAPTDPILYLEGGPIISMRASGAIKAGQALSVASPTIIDNIDIKVADDLDTGFIGVAGYAAADNGLIQVLGPGNIIRGIIAGTAKCTYGDDLMISGAEGKFANANITYGTKVGVALQTQATNNGTAIILLT